MKTAGAALIALLATGSFVLADLYTFTLVDGTVLRFTTADRDIAISGSTWSAAGPFADVSPDGSGRSQKSTATQKIGLDVDTKTIAIQPRAFDPFSGAAYPDRIAGQPFLAAVAAGALDGGQVRVDRAYWPSWGPANAAMPVPTGLVGSLFVGRVAGVAFDRGVVAVTINSQLELLTQQIPRNFYGAACRHTLFDQGCTLSASAFARSGTIGGVVSAARFTSAVAAPPGSATYAQGRLTFSSGLNKGVSRFISDWSAATGLFSLKPPAPYALQVGDAFTATPGCDKSQNTCRKFANVANFGGMPFIPVVDTAV